MEENKGHKPWADAAFSIDHALPRHIAAVKPGALLAAVGGRRRQVFETDSDLSLTSCVSLAVIIFGS